MSKTTFRPSPPTTKWPIGSPGGLTVGQSSERGTNTHLKPSGAPVGAFVFLQSFTSGSFSLRDNTTDWYSPITASRHIPQKMKLGAHVIPFLQVAINALASICIAIAAFSFKFHSRSAL